MQNIDKQNNYYYAFIMHVKTNWYTARILYTIILSLTMVKWFIYIYKLITNLVMPVIHTYTSYYRIYILQKKN